MAITDEYIAFLNYWEHVPGLPQVYAYALHRPTRYQAHYNRSFSSPGHLSPGRSKCLTTPLFSMLCLFFEFPVSVLPHLIHELCLGLPLPLFVSILPFIQREMPLRMCPIQFFCLVLIISIKDLFSSSAMFMEFIDLFKSIVLQVILRLPFETGRTSTLVCIIRCLSGSILSTWRTRRTDGKHASLLRLVRTNLSCIV